MAKTAVSAVKILHRSYKKSVLEISIRQGLNRLVRRMLVKVGLKASLLKRTKIGKLTVRGLGAGKYRALTQAEVAYLKRIKKQC